MEPRQLRDKANEALTKGRFTRAAELFEEYCKLDPKDFQTRLRLGDAWSKAGNSARAIVAYQAAAEGFAREGLLPRAIAASKLILELDPSHQGVQQMLANLYARRSGTGSALRAVMPRSADPAPVQQAAAEAPPPTTQSALYIDLPPEVEETLARDEAAEASFAEEETPGSSSGVEVELDLSGVEQGSEEAAPSSADIEVELDLSGAEQGSEEVAPSPTVVQAAPPGLRPRRTSEVRPIVPEPSPQADFQTPVPGSMPLMELETETQSLLHAVELAALAGTEPQAEPATAGQVAEDTGSAASGEQVTEAPAQEGGLPTIPLFSDLPRDAFIALFERCALRRFPEGTHIIEQGTRGDAFYVICAGRVRIVRQRGTQQRELAVLEEGAFFGEMALLSGAPRSASVVSAAEETQVLEISAPVLAALSRRFPQVARALRRFCRQRLLSNVVNTSALFKPFGRKDRRELVERFLAREVRRGDVILHEGQQVDGLYVVLSGEVAVSKGGQSLARLREGELFGEMSMLQKTPASATVTAARHTSLLRLPREHFDALILTHPQILALVSELTESRQRSNEALLGAEPKASEPGERFEDLMMV